MLMANDICVTFREEIYKNGGKEELLPKARLSPSATKAAGKIYESAELVPEAE